MRTDRRRGRAASALALAAVWFAAPPAPAPAEGLLSVNPPEMRRSPFYSHAVIAPAGGRIVHVAGQIGLDAEGRLAPGYEAQVRQAFANLRTVLGAAGALPEHVAKITVLIADHDEAKLGPLAEASEALFGTHRPASTLIPVPRLALDGLLFEIDAVAVIPE